MTVRDVLKVTGCKVTIIDDPSGTELEFHGNWKNPILDLKVTHIEPVASEVGKYGIAVFVG